MNELKKAFRLLSDGDSWGTTMGAWFSVAAELHNRGECVPNEWQYGPSPFEPQEVDEFWADEFESESAETLIEFGNLLNRYADKLRAAGEDY